MFKNRIMYKVILFILATAFFLGSCKKKETTKIYSPSCDGSTKSFTNDVKPIMQSYCVSCHSSYSSYTSIKTSSSQIRNSIVSGSMPKGSSLSNDQKNNIVCWIDAGMPNN